MTPVSFVKSFTCFALSTLFLVSFLFFETVARVFHVHAWETRKPMTKKPEVAFRHFRKQRQPRTAFKSCDKSGQKEHLRQHQTIVCQALPSLRTSNPVSKALHPTRRLKPRSSSPFFQLLATSFMVCTAVLCSSHHGWLGPSWPDRPILRRFKPDLQSVNISLLVAAIVRSSVHHFSVGKVFDHPRITASRKNVCSTHAHAVTNRNIGRAEPKTLDVQVYPSWRCNRSSMAPQGLNGLTAESASKTPSAPTTCNCQELFVIPRVFKADHLA